ncbi:MAG: hypothetical protein AAGC64_05565 [Bacteroidota bacterium]
MKNKLYTLEEAQNLLEEGVTAIVGAEESLLKQLPKGKWIGGTMPYFMAEGGGTVSQNKVFLHHLDDRFQINQIKHYKEHQLENIFDDYPTWGVSFIIIPSLSEVAFRYPFVANKNIDVLKSPLIGWLSGVLWDHVGKVDPKVIDGQTCTFYDNQALVMHCDLPGNVSPSLGTINIFEPAGPIIEFEEETTEISEAIIDGKKQNLYDYIKSINVDIQQPFITDVSGSLINTSIKEIDDTNRLVKVWTPTWPGYKYQLSKVVDNYEEKFETELKAINKEMVFNCNCLYNYLFGKLKGKKIGNVTGLITFGEIAYLLLDQTLVYLTLDEEK